MSDTRMGLAGTLALLAATVAGVFGVALSTEDRSSAAIADTAGSSADEAASQPKLDSDELLELGLELTPAVARRVAEIRGLKFDEVPKPQVTDVESLRRLADKEIAKPKVAETLAAGEAELKLLGLLEPEDSLADVSTEVTADAAAYYDPKKKELFLLGDAVPAGPALTEFVLAHELDHALEDEEFGLPFSNVSNDDRALAESALVEGSATSLMAEYAVEHIGAGELLSESAGLEDGADHLPPIAMAQVTFSYFGGQRFVDELKATAGGGWDLVDFAYQRRLPASTEQVLHPEKYLDDEQPLPVPGPPDAGSGWEEVDAGVVGEFVTREILRQDAEKVGADSAAAGWGGDRYRLFRRAGAPEECADACRADHALAIVWRGDDATETAELDEALRGFVERSLGGEDGDDGTWELDGGWAAIDTTDDVTTLALAPDEDLALKLARPAG
ncbi:MAG TPA: hypothetical protein VD766_05030 [Solirubrobacterales bacterium]|nr:hypothetical protein [Solirubrobacterales bacterium]